LSKSVVRAAAANSNKGSPIVIWPRTTSGFTSNCSAVHRLKRQPRTLKTVVAAYYRRSPRSLSATGRTRRGELIAPCSLLRAAPRRSGTPCCSSKHDSKLFRSTGTRGCAPFGAALRYCTGHAIGCSSSRAARNGQYGSRKNSRAIITASACPVRMMCSAWTGEVIIPTAPVMTPASSRIFWAKAVW